MISETMRELIAAAAIIIAIIFSGVLIFSFLENWTALDSIYFVVTSAFTVGYGDIVVSPENRLITAVYLICVCTLTLACSSVLGNGFLQIIQDRAMIKRDKRITLDIKRKIEDLRESGQTISEEDILDLKAELDLITKDFEKSTESNNNSRE